MLNYPVSPRKIKLLLDRMAALGIKEQDLEEKFIRGSGAGGQKINKTSSTVYLKHLPSGTEVKCQESRQLIMNRYYARSRMCDLIENELLGKQSAEQKNIHKLRKQKARRSRKSKEKMLKDKLERSKIKSTRNKKNVAVE